MKSILLISRCPPFPLHFGDRLILWHLARELSRRGYVLDLLALYDRDDDPMLRGEYSGFFRHVELFRERRRGAAAYMRRILQPSRRFAKDAKSSFHPDLWRAIESRLRTHNYDLVHAFGSVSVYEFHPLFAHLPNLITPYESTSLYLGSAAQLGRMGARFRLPFAEAMERFMFTPYQRTVVIAEDDRQALLGLQPNLRIDVIPNGIELERFALDAIEREDATLLFVGNYAYAPNQDAARLLLDSIMPAIWQRMPRAKLQFVGVNPPDWMREISEARVEVTGFVPDVTPYLALATAFVCPLRIGAGLKNKLLEALAAGAPVVATPLAAAGIDVVDGESALIREPGDFAEGVLRLLQDDGLRRKLSRQGRELVERRYTWSRVADAYEALYAEIRRGVGQ